LLGVLFVDLRNWVDWGFPASKELTWALQIRCLWLHKTEPTLPIQVPDKVKALFSMAMQTKTRDGKNTLFWSDYWMHGQKIADLAPRLLNKRINNHSVSEALAAAKWFLTSKALNCWSHHRISASLGYAPTLSCHRESMTFTSKD
jgi:hypothetical protein